MDSRTYRNGVLTAIAGLLGVLALGQWSHGQGGLASPAVAGPATQPESGGLISAAQQRKLMLRELELVNRRLDAIDARLAGELRVVVTDMPEIKLPDDGD